MKKQKGFTLIELLAVIVVLAIIMIIAIPNILNTMNTSKKQSLKVEAQKMFNEAAKKYEEEGLTGIPLGQTTDPKSDFTKVGTTYVIGVSQKLANNQSKYRGCVIVTPSTSGTVAYTMKISITDGEFMYLAKEESAIKTDTNLVDFNQSTWNNGHSCGSVS